MAVCMSLFAFSSVLGWSLYGERCVQFLWGERAKGAYRAVFAITALTPALTGFKTVISVSDALSFLMLCSNMVSLCLLRQNLKAENCNFIQDLPR